jgi:hypothetical protein
MITVYCDDPSHAEKPWECLRFRLASDGTWHGSNLRFKNELHYRAGEIKTMVWLENERRYLSVGETRPPGARARVRPRLHCGRCPVTFARSDTTVLYAVLDKLSQAGETEVSLRTLNLIAARIEADTKLN